jgi:Arc/MetJ-type ribon-helix-helix transcriptional regulator
MMLGFGLGVNRSLHVHTVSYTSRSKGDGLMTGSFNVLFPEELANLIDEKVHKQFGSRSDFLRAGAVRYLREDSNSRSSSRDVQLPGDLSLGATLGEQFGGAFPTGPAGGALLGGPRSCLLLAVVSRTWPGMLHQPPTVPQDEKNQ